MCDCQKKGDCGGKTKELRKYRNSIVTLYNYEKDPTKRTDYQEKYEALDILLLEYDTTATCPDPETLLELKNYIESEYSTNN